MCISQLNEVKILINNTHICGILYPHFDVDYNGHNAKFSIEALKQISGILPKNIVDNVLEWAFQNKSVLYDNWKKVAYQTN